MFQAGEKNPEVQLSVVSLNGPLHTVVMKKPDDPRIGWAAAGSASFNKKKKKAALSLRKFKDGACLFQEGVLHHHGEMGHQHQTGRHLVEPRSEQLHPDAVWSYNRNLHQGETETKEVKFCTLFCSLFFLKTLFFGS